LTTSEFEVAAFEAGQFVTIAKKQVEAAITKKTQILNNVILMF